LQRAAETDTSGNTRLEEIHVGLGSLSPLRGNLGFNFLVFELDQFVVRVTLAVKISENLESLLFTKKIFRL
jgi:hypothetical protein